MSMTVDRSHRSMIKSVMGILCDLRTEGHEVKSKVFKHMK